MPKGLHKDKGVHTGTVYVHAKAKTKVNQS